MATVGAVRFVVRFVVQIGALIGVVIFAVFFFNFRSDVVEQGSVAAPTTEVSPASSVVEGEGRYGPVSLVGGADYNLNAVVATRPVVFWFWAPG